MLKQSNQEIEIEVYQNRVMKSFINVFVFCIYLHILVSNTKGVSLVKQELLALPEHPSSPLCFSGVRVINRPFLFCVVFCRKSFVLMSFDHYVVCPSSIYRFWLSLWYLPTLLIYKCRIMHYK